MGFYAGCHPTNDYGLVPIPNAGGSKLDKHRELIGFKSAVWHQTQQDTEDLLYKMMPDGRWKDVYTRM